MQILKEMLFYLLTSFVILVFQNPIQSQTITKGPYLANPVANSMTIRWESDVKADFVVKYGRNKSMGKSLRSNLIEQKASGFLYQAVIEKLKPGQKYFYEVNSVNIKSRTETFKVQTEKLDDFSFVVFGDSRSKPHVLESFSKQISQIKPVAVIANGDLVAKGGDLSGWQSKFFDPLQNVIGHIPFISAVGDHESDNVDGDNAELFTHFLLPQKDNMELWFSYDFGNAHFIFLDWRYPNSKEMADWFKKDIEQSTKTWNFVVMHRSPYNMGGHHVSWGKNTWPLLFRENKIDVVFSGHSHLYERFYPTRPKSEPGSWPVTYITTGGAGASLYEAVSGQGMAFTKSVNHFLRVDIKKEQITIKALGVDGLTIDSVSWNKNKGTFNKEFLATIKPQENLDIMNVFNSEISRRMERLPMVEVPYKPYLLLDAKNVKEDIEYTIRLAEESEGKYKMQRVSGTIKAGMATDIRLEIYGRTTMTVSKWGDLRPVLRLIAEYKTKNYNGTVKGKILEYIAW
jgi:hypothetical protein